MFVTTAHQGGSGGAILRFMWVLLEEEQEIEVLRGNSKPPL